MKTTKARIESLYQQAEELRKDVSPHLSAIIQSIIGDEIWVVVDTYHTHFGESWCDEEDSVESVVIEAVFLRFDEALEYVKRYKENTDQTNKTRGFQETGDIEINGLLVKYHYEEPDDTTGPDTTMVGDITIERAPFNYKFWE